MITKYKICLLMISFSLLALTASYGAAPLFLYPLSYGGGNGGSDTNTTTPRAIRVGFPLLFSPRRKRYGSAIFDRGQSAFRPAAKPPAQALAGPEFVEVGDQEESKVGKSRG